MSKHVYAEFERCIRCQGCEVACQREHSGHGNVNVVLVQDRFAVPIACRHCDPAPCALACPNDALEGDGIEVKLDAEKCTGCKLCLLACPFGAMGFNSISKKAAKCDLCAARRTAGKKPACVLTCPCRALEFDHYETYSSLRRQRVLTMMIGEKPLERKV